MCEVHEFSQNDIIWCDVIHADKESRSLVRVHFVIFAVFPLEIVFLSDPTPFRSSPHCVLNMQNKWILFLKSWVNGRNKKKRVEEKFMNSPLIHKQPFFRRCVLFVLFSFLLFLRFVKFSDTVFFMAEREESKKIHSTNFSHRKFMKFILQNLKILNFWGFQSTERWALCKQVTCDGFPVFSFHCNLKVPNKHQKVNLNWKLYHAERAGRIPSKV